MAILSLSSDQLKYDSLREERLGKRQFDPLGKDEGKRVKTYDKELGYAMHPEEKEATDLYKGQIDTAAGEQQKAISEYDSTYKKQMAAADAQGDGLLATAQNQLGAIKKPTFDLVPVRVFSGNVFEGEYLLPRDAVEKLATESFNGQEGHYASKWDNDKTSLNVDTQPVGSSSGYGAELHASLAEGVNQVLSAQKIADERYNTAMQVGQSQIDSARETLNSQRGIAQNSYNQQMLQGNAVLDSIKAKWTTHVTEQRAAFQDGIKTNNGGIRDLIDSGALTMKGSVK